MITLRGAACWLGIWLLACGDEKHVTGFTKVTSLSESAEDNAPVDLVFTPSGYVVAYRNGRLERRDLHHAILATALLPVRRGNECGLLAVEVDPTDEHRLYDGRCVPDAGIVLETFVWDEVPTAFETLIDLPAAQNGFHNLGDLGFDAQGNLFVSFGDGNTRGTPQDLTDLRGKLLRLTPTPGGAAPYVVPDDNPLVGIAEARPEILAWGFKSPFRVAYGRDTWFIGDVGLEAYEEIDATTLAGPHDFGYPLCEGNSALADYVPVNSDCGLTGDDYGPPQLVYHQEDYDQAVVRDDPEVERGSLWAVVGGVFYDAERHAELTGHLLYADYGRGFVRHARWDGSRLAGDAHLAHLPRITALAVSLDGQVYALSGNALYRLD